MRYRWFNVDVEVNEDGTAEVRFEGRGEFPFGETVVLEEGDSIRAHGHIDIVDSLSDQPSNVEWHFGDKSSDDES
jgi:hypothetical protein